MKLSAKKIAEAEVWVEEHGLYPQKFGAKIQDFCDAIGITDRCYRNWKEISEFSEAISRAREVFRVRNVRKVENALLKAAMGVDFVKEKQEFKAQVIKEYDPKTGKKIKEYTSDKPIQTKAYRETYYYPPDVKAAQFVLTNMDPENWKNKQEADMSLDVTSEEPPVIVFRDGSAKAEEQQAEPEVE